MNSKYFKMALENLINNIDSFIGEDIVDSLQGTAAAYLHWRTLLLAERSKRREAERTFRESIAKDTFKKCILYRFAGQNSNFHAAVITHTVDSKCCSQYSTCRQIWSRLIDLMDMA